MKKIFVIFLILFSFFCITSSSLAIEFSDLPTTHWAYENITKLVNRGIVNGYTDGTFKPSNPITRGEFFKLIMTTLYYGEDYLKGDTSGFEHWATVYALDAQMKGYLMTGTSTTNLNDEMSRLEMANVLCRVCLNNGIKAKVFDPENVPQFTDIDDLDEESKLYINYIVENGLVNGYTDGTFKPNNTMTRAEVSTVLIRLMNLKMGV